MIAKRLRPPFSLTDYEVNQIHKFAVYYISCGCTVLQTIKTSYIAQMNSSRMLHEVNSNFLDAKSENSEKRRLESCIVRSKISRKVDNNGMYSYILCIANVLYRGHLDRKKS